MTESKPLTMIKTDEEILDSWYEAGMHWKASNRYNILKAMNEYASQFPSSRYREALDHLSRKIFKSADYGANYVIETEDLKIINDALNSGEEANKEEK